MASASKARASRSEGGRLLKGSDVPKSKTAVTVAILGVREAPEEWTSPLIADIEETYECESVALNKTNVDKAIELMGDDYDEWNKYDATFKVVPQRNPKGGIVRGLLLDSVKRAAKRKARRDDDIPF